MRIDIMKGAIPPLVFLLFASSSHAGMDIPPQDAARIVAAAKRVALAPPGRWTFAVIAETSSQRFVQFSQQDGSPIFDFPILSARKPDAAGTVKDAGCSAKPPPSQPGEREERYLSAKDEARLRNVLTQRQVKWTSRYCLSLTREGKRVGYTMSLVGRLPEPESVPAFVQAVWVDAFDVRDIKSIEIKTDE